MSIQILIGDCRSRMAELPDASVDSVVCDPPYHLTSNNMRLRAMKYNPSAKDGLARKKLTGFMGQTWDGGDVAFDPETWAEVLRVLKPGGHLVAFSGTRTSHRMVCAIEDAGFEIRDSILDIIASDDPVRQFLQSLGPSQIEAFFRCIEDSQFGGMLAWVYGSGFPKSLDVSKAIDKRGGNPDLAPKIAAAIKAAREVRGWTTGKADAYFCGGSTNWTWFEGRKGIYRPPSPETFARIAAEWPELAALSGLVAEVDREVIGSNDRKAGWFAAQDGHDITAPATEAAQQWQGWGTALKPSWEPICLARKPLIGSVAQNVLTHGTGALNIDGCRIEGESITTTQGGKRIAGGNFNNKHGEQEARKETFTNTAGRWPANLCHDGSEEVLAGFPETESGSLNPSMNVKPSTGWSGGSQADRVKNTFEANSGSAARFFYCAKSSTEERGEGNNHPTVKPIALMQWLVRLVTPKGGTVLDPFSGSGSTLIAADMEQMNAIGCELSPEYAAIAEKRIRDAAGMFADVTISHQSEERTAAA